MKTLKFKKMEQAIELTLVEKMKMVQFSLEECHKRIDSLVAELEINPNFPEQHIITKESWDNAEKIVHEGFIFVKYTDLMFYK
jgi:hypothetical protein